MSIPHFRRYVWLLTRKIVHEKLVLEYKLIVDATCIGNKINSQKLVHFLYLYTWSNFNNVR